MDSAIKKKKEQSSDTYHNMDKPQKYVKWKKSDIQGHILYDHIYPTGPE